MFAQGEQVIYASHGVCKIVGLEDRKFANKAVRYYVLEPVAQSETRYYVPTDNAAAVAKLRRILTTEELNKLLSSDDARRDLWIDDENRRKQQYRDLITGGDRAALVSMVGTLRKQRKACADTGRKFHQCDENFLRDAENLLESEFSTVLAIDRAQVGDYVKKILGT